MTTYVVLMHKTFPEYFLPLVELMPGANAKLFRIEMLWCTPIDSSIYRNGQNWAVHTRLGFGSMSFERHTTMRFQCQN